eukprot:TRINITY_DN6393_c0_g1_i2.p1 TRINITY_DN6393_c0_g1~~TRINITY_DN6393_c0_g1_i2.p1  ORF type:complete len:1156 (+),score=314.78 TRINITY_DN6393_c0_g1_i2:515-3469(+)
MEAVSDSDDGWHDDHSVASIRWAPPCGGGGQAASCPREAPPETWRPAADALGEAEGRGRSELECAEAREAQRIELDRQHHGASAAGALREVLHGRRYSECSLLHAAVALGDAEMAAEVARGAALEATDAGGSTPLVAAVRAAAASSDPRPAAVVRALLDAGARADGAASSQHGWAPVHYAAAAGRAAIISALLDSLEEGGRGSEANRKDYAGDAPLHVLAARAGQGGMPERSVSESCAALFASGADAAALGGRGESAAQLLLAPWGTRALRAELEREREQGRDSLRRHLSELAEGSHTADASRRSALQELQPLLQLPSPSPQPQAECPVPTPQRSLPGRSPAPAAADPPPRIGHHGSAAAGASPPPVHAPGGRAPPPALPLPLLAPQSDSGVADPRSPSVIALGAASRAALGRAAEQARALLAALPDNEAGSAAEELTVAKRPSARMGTGWQRVGDSLLLAGVEPGSPADLSGAGRLIGRRLLSACGAAVTSAAAVKALADGNGLVRLCFADDGPHARRRASLGAARSRAAEIAGLCEAACSQGAAGIECFAAAITLAQELRDGVCDASAGGGTGVTAQCAASCDALLQLLRTGESGRPAAPPPGVAQPPAAGEAPPPPPGAAAAPAPRAAEPAPPQAPTPQSLPCAPPEAAPADAASSAGSLSAADCGAEGAAGAQGAADENLRLSPAVWEPSESNSRHSGAPECSSPAASAERPRSASGGSEPPAASTAPQPASPEELCSALASLLGKFGSLRGAWAMMRNMDQRRDAPRGSVSNEAVRRGLQCAGCRLEAAAFVAALGVPGGEGLTQRELLQLAQHRPSGSVQPCTPPRALHGAPAVAGEGAPHQAESATSGGISDSAPQHASPSPHQAAEEGRQGAESGTSGGEASDPGAPRPAPQPESPHPSPRRTRELQLTACRPVPAGEGALEDEGESPPSPAAAASWEAPPTVPTGDAAGPARDSTPVCAPPGAGALELAAAAGRS